MKGVYIAHDRLGAEVDIAGKEGDDGDAKRKKGGENKADAGIFLEAEEADKYLCEERGEKSGEESADEERGEIEQSGSPKRGGDKIGERDAEENGVGEGVGEQRHPL